MKTHDTRTCENSVPCSDCELSWKNAGFKTANTLEKALGSILGETTHNGWENYETWLVKLWIDNSETAVNSVHDMLKGLEVDEADGLLRDWVNEWIDIEGDMSTNACLAVDLVQSALSKVNWRELTEAYMDNSISDICTFGNCQDKKYSKGDDDLCEKHFLAGINK